MSDFVYRREGGYGGNRLKCDGPDCEVMFPETPEKGWYPRIRSDAAEAGWLTVSRRHPNGRDDPLDYCPRHIHLSLKVVMTPYDGPDDW